MSPRPLVFVSGLTFGDYLLWTWSLNHNHDVLALISGLTLPPLALACAWLIVLSIARALAHFARMPRARLARERRLEAHADTRSAPARAAAADEAGGAIATADAHAGKLAA